MVEEEVLAKIWSDWKEEVVITTGKKYKPVRLKRWKVLKVAARAHRMDLALRAISLPKLPRTIRRLYTPQTETAKRWFKMTPYKKRK